MPKLTREEMIGRGKVPVATQLSSRQIRDRWDARLKEEAVFSARTTSKAYIDAVKKRLVEVIGGTLSPQEAERRLRETLRDLGYSPAGGFGDNRVPAAKAGDIRDLSSSRRIQLVIDTNVKYGCGSKFESFIIKYGLLVESGIQKFIGLFDKK